MTDPLQPHGLQQARPPCHPLSPRVYRSSCPLNQWCHLIISSSVALLSFCLQTFPKSRSFPVSQLFTSCGPSTAALASASVLPMSIQDWSPLGWTGWISLQSKGLSKSSPTPQLECISSLALCLLYGPTLTSMHDYWKDHSLDYVDLCWQSDIFAF